MTQVGKIELAKKHLGYGIGGEGLETILNLLDDFEQALNIPPVIESDSPSEEEVINIIADCGLFDLRGYGYDEYKKSYYKKERESLMESLNEVYSR